MECEFDNKVKEFISKNQHYVIISVLLFLLGFGIYLAFELATYIFDNGPKSEEIKVKYFPPFAILIASQIAGFAVLATINNTNRIEKQKQEEEKLKAARVLKSYFRHLINLAEEQINYLDILQKNYNPSYASLVKLDLSSTNYDKDINIISFLNPIESMLNHDLHKYTDEEVLDFILKLKSKILNMMHSMKSIESMPNMMDQRKAIMTMKNDIKETIQEAKSIINRI